jgi:hypothetical protein
MIINREIRGNMRRQFFLLNNKEITIQDLNSITNLYMHIKFINRAAIDGFLPAGLAGKKVCVRLRSSAVEKNNPVNPVQ